MQRQARDECITGAAPGILKVQDLCPRRGCSRTGIRPQGALQSDEIAHPDGPVIETVVIGAVPFAGCGRRACAREERHKTVDIIPLQQTVAHEIAAPAPVDAHFCGGTPVAELAVGVDAADAEGISARTILAQRLVHSGRARSDAHDFIGHGDESDVIDKKALALKQGIGLVEELDENGDAGE